MASRHSTVLCPNRLTWILPDCHHFLVVLDGRLLVRVVAVVRRACGRQTLLHQQVSDLSSTYQRLLAAL